MAQAKEAPPRAALLSCGAFRKRTTNPRPSAWEGFAGVPWDSVASAKTALEAVFDASATSRVRPVSGWLVCTWFALLESRRRAKRQYVLEKTYTSHRLPGPAGPAGSARLVDVLRRYARNVGLPADLRLIAFRSANNAVHRNHVVLCALDRMVVVHPDIVVPDAVPLIGH